MIFLHGLDTYTIQSFILPTKKTVQLIFFTMCTFFIPNVLGLTQNQDLKNENG